MTKTANGVRLTYAQAMVLYKAGLGLLGVHKRPRYRPALRLLELGLVRVDGKATLHNVARPGGSTRTLELVRYVATERGMEWLHAAGLLESVAG